MGRLADTLKRAAEAKAGLEVAVERDVMNYVDRVGQIHKRREDVFMRKHSELDLDVTDLAEFEKDLEDFGKKRPLRRWRERLHRHGTAEALGNL